MQDGKITELFIYLFHSLTSFKKAVYFNQKEAFNSSIKHYGDNLSGSGSGYDEIISICTQNLPETITALVITVHSYSYASNLQDLEYLNCDIIDLASKEILKKISIVDSGFYFILFGLNNFFIQ